MSSSASPDAALGLSILIPKPPAVDPTAAVSFDLQAIDDTDLSPCDISRYPADRFLKTNIFVSVPIVAVNEADPSFNAVPPATLLTAIANANAQLGGNNGSNVEVPAWAASMPPDVGVLLLEQIRIRPAGTVIGEHVYTLGLGPLEKVTLTVTTSTKKTVSLESLTDSTQQTSYEFDSTFSNELASNTQNEMDNQSQQKLTVSANAGYPGVGSVSAGYSASSSNSDKNIQSQSVKTSQQTTQKVSSQSKLEHRVTFSTQTETGVENVAQRVFQNPNTAHSLMLNFYKILQRHEVFHERYGAVMCWAPCIVDPERSAAYGPKKLQTKWRR